MTYPLGPALAQHALESIEWDGQAWSLHSYTEGGPWSLYVSRYGETFGPLLPPTQYGTSYDFYDPVGRKRRTDPETGISVAYEGDGLTTPLLNAHDREGKALPGFPKSLTVPPGTTYISTRAIDVSPSGIWVTLRVEKPKEPSPYSHWVCHVGLDGTQGPWLPIPVGWDRVVGRPDGTGVVVVWTGSGLETWIIEGDAVSNGWTNVEHLGQPETSGYVMPIRLLRGGTNLWLVSTWFYASSTHYRVNRIMPGCMYSDAVSEQ